MDRILITEARPDSEDAVALVRALDDELGRLYPGVAIQGLRPEHAAARRLTFFVARAGDRPVGCAALRELDPRTGEIKRMFVLDESRGRGIARRLLLAIEVKARALGYSALRLETGPRQPEAVALYRSAGYEPISPYGEYVGNPVSQCFEKRIDGLSSE
jgi:putative acetyltransferase